METDNGFLASVKEFFSMEKSRLRIVRMDYPNDLSKDRNFNYIRSFFDMTKKKEYTLDDQTWDDLCMDDVYEKLDRTYSSLGEEILYTMLRNPIMDEEKLKRRNRLIELFKDNARLREKLQCIFYKLGKNTHNSYLEMIKDDLVNDKGKYILYTVLGKIAPPAIILAGIFLKPQYFLLLFIVSIVNTTINIKETKAIRSNGICYLRDIIKAARKMSRINNKELTRYTEKIKSILSQIKGIERGTKFIGLETRFGGLLEPISGALLLQESSYYSISEQINQNKKLLIELYYLMGELEAFISIAGYQESLYDDFVHPKFVQDLVLNIEQGVHPLIVDAVPNSISIQNNGIVLTGTNMAGKSTFLRMLGVNMLLCETFYFALAQNYEACFFNIVSSISPSDDISTGKSFFMAEVEAISRIINAFKKDVPVFCPIDEIFRGTNPIERISMSAEILLYLNRGKSISIVATHDRELVEILKQNYEFYYFSENVDSKNGLSFDYKLKHGVSQTRNAIKLLEYSGYPKEIVDNAYARAEKIEGFI